MKTCYSHIFAGIFLLLILFANNSLHAQGCLDAAFYIDDSDDFVHMFRGDETRAHGWNSNSSASTVDVNSRWTGLEDWTGIDAAFNLSEGRIVAFRGSEMSWIQENTKAALAAPAPITTYMPFLPQSFQEGIDAAFAWSGGTDKMEIFLFKRNEYIKVDFDIPGNRFLNAQAAATGGWAGVLTTHFTEGVDAAMYYAQWSAVYFFRGNEYIRYNSQNGFIEPDYPKPTSDPTNWGNLFADWSCIDPQSNVTCSMNYEIPDNSCSDANEVEFEIAGFQNRSLGTDVQVEGVVIYIEHPYVSDLTLTLISPTGKEVLLAEERGGSSDNYGTSCDGNDLTYFTRNASQSITSASAPFSGQFLPEGDFDDFNDGSSPNGMWKLRMCDGANDDKGTLIGFRLNFDNITTSLEDVHTLGIGMAVSPNPSTGLIRVKLAQAQPQALQFQVLDVTGKSVFAYQEQLAGTQFETTFDLSELANGMYFLRVQSGGLVTTERIVIQK